MGDAIDEAMGEGDEEEETEQVVQQVEIAVLLIYNPLIRFLTSWESN